MQEIFVKRYISLQLISITYYVGQLLTKKQLRSIPIAFLSNIEGRNTHYIPLGLKNQFHWDTVAHWY